MYTYIYYNFTYTIASFSILSYNIYICMYVYYILYTITLCKLWVPHHPPLSGGFTTRIPTHPPTQLMAPWLRWHYKYFLKEPKIQIPECISSIDQSLDES